LHFLGDDRRSSGGYQVERRGGERKSWGDSRGGSGNWKDYGRQDRYRSQSGGQGGHVSADIAIFEFHLVLSV
jgi:hypothetical protein